MSASLRDVAGYRFSRSTEAISRYAIPILRELEPLLHTHGNDAALTRLPRASFRVTGSGGDPIAGAANSNWRGERLLEMKPPS
ncbi:hypothetical protein D3C76_1204380 [compost metagenome]